MPLKQVLGIGEEMTSNRNKLLKKAEDVISKENNHLYSICGTRQSVRTQY